MNVQNNLVSRTLSPRLNGVTPGTTPVTPLSKYLDKRRGSNEGMGGKTRTYFLSLLVIAIIGGYLVVVLNDQLTSSSISNGVETQAIGETAILGTGETKDIYVANNDGTVFTTEKDSLISSLEPSQVNLNFETSARISRNFLDRSTRRARGFPTVIHIVQVVKKTGVGVSAYPGWNVDKNFGKVPHGAIIAATQRKKLGNLEHYQLSNFRWISTALGQNARRIRSILVPHGVMRRVKFPTSKVCATWLEVNNDPGIGTPERLSNMTLAGHNDTLPQRCNEEVAVYREIGRLLKDTNFILSPDNGESSAPKFNQVRVNRQNQGPEVATIVGHTPLIKLLPPHNFKKSSITDDDPCEQNVYFLTCAHSPECTWRQDRGACYKDVNSNFSPENFEGDYDATFEFSPSRTPPTHWPGGRGNEEKPKYFLYQPSGGYNNQRLEMQTALIASRLLNRTVILPHIAAHTNIFTNYNKQPPSRMVPAQLLLNVKRLREVVDVVTMPLGMGLPEFVAKYRNSFTWRTEVKSFSKPLSEKGTIREFGDEPADIIYFANSSMWQSFLFKGGLPGSSYPRDRYIIQSNMMYTDRIKRVALRIAKWLGNYHCAHVRVGDTRATHQKNFLSGSWYAKRLAKFSNETTKVYIATDERSEDYFDAMVRYGLQPTFAKDIPRKLIEPHLKLFPERMYFDMLGTVEQLVCTYANKFMGTFYSTFTMTILMFRKYRPISAPIMEPKAGDPLRLPQQYFQNTTCDHFRAWYTTTAC